MGIRDIVRAFRGVDVLPALAVVPRSFPYGEETTFSELQLRRGLIL